MFMMFLLSTTKGLNMQFSFTLLISISIVAFAAGYVFKSTQDTRNFIQEQKEMLTYQVVTINGTPYRFNRETGKLASCSLKQNQNGNFSAMKCKKQ